MINTIEKQQYMPRFDFLRAALKNIQAFGILRRIDW